MTPASVYTLFFSPTGTTARTADAIAAALARDTARPDASVPVRRIDLTHAAAAPVTLPRRLPSSWPYPSTEGTFRRWWPNA